METASENRVVNTFSGVWNGIVLGTKCVSILVYDIIRHPIRESVLIVDDKREPKIIPRAEYEEYHYNNLTNKLTEKVYDQIVADPLKRDTFKQKLRETLSELEV